MDEVKSTAGERSVNAFLAWKASMTVDDFRQIIFRGSLNRTEIAKGCGIAKAALRQNPKVRALLQELEDDLRSHGTLPPLAADVTEAKNAPVLYDRTASKRVRESRRVAELEKEVLELKARLRRFEELSQVLTEMGIEV